MKRAALSLLLLAAGVATPAAAQATLENQRGKWALSSAKISDRGASKAFGTADLEAFCFFPSNPQYGATILRAGTNFYALNGNGRTNATGATVTWRGVKYRVQDEGFGTDRAEVLGGLVTPGNAACQ